MPRAARLRRFAVIVSPVLAALALLVVLALRERSSPSPAGALALRPTTTGAPRATPLEVAALTTEGAREQRTSAGLGTAPVTAPRGDASERPARPATQTIRICPLGPLNVDATRARFELWSGAWRAPVLTPRRDGAHLVVDVPREHLALRSLVARLSVEDGAWSSGAVELGTIQPSALANGRTTLTVALAPMGSLDLVCVLGHALAPERLSVLVQARSDLASTADFGGRECGVDWSPTTSHGPRAALTYGFERVPAGSNRVEAHEVRSVSAEADAHVRQGALTTVELDLTARPLLGALGGVVRFDRPLEGRAGIVVQNVEEPGLRFEVELRSPWLLENVPAGTYDVIGLPGSLSPVEPPTYRVSAASTSLDFTVHNAADSIAIGFDVTDAATGDRLTGVQLHIERPNGNVRKLSLDHLRQPERLPRNAPVTWRLLCEGFEPATGTMAAFARVDARPAAFQQPGRAPVHADRPLVDIWIADVRLQRAAVQVKDTKR